MKPTRELWLRVEPLLATALELPPAARDGWLREVAATHPREAPLLRRLLASHERAERSGALETVPRLAPAPAWSSPHAAGERIGPFELVSALGHGGMGEVWLARQADGRIERTVALKLPSLDGHDATWRERFVRERDILARLEHPHIARLYDAGVTDAAQPWLAMEYVAGLPLLEHARALALTLPQRLELFRQVLAAVAHAHRHLVVHRDLKPANILVDGAGQVKLLDFGIAKLVDGDAAGEAASALTRQGGRPMTLRYAAPEQVALGQITTATDIYALGVILHELLTGLAPYRAMREGKPLTEWMLVNEEPALPSRLQLTAALAAERGLATADALARRLAGDLDAIVLKALRRDAAQRYGTVELLDADIVAHLHRRPVHARSGTWRYLAGRYLLRHKLPFAAAGAILVTLLAGLVVAERERRAAVAEKARAERHFASVRSLANTFIFDVHRQLEPLAGSLEARRTLVRTALQYLDRLADESRQDTGLALEIAGAYRRLAEISGDSRGAHLGDPAAAQRLAERATVLLEAVEGREPAHLAALREHRIVALLLGRLRLEAGDANGVEDTRRAVGLAERALAAPGSDLSDRRDLGATLAELGGILAVVRGDVAAAAVPLARSVQVLEALAQEHPGDSGARAALAYAYERSATAAEVSGDASRLPQAIELHRRSVATLESVVREQPGHGPHLQTLVKRYNNAARATLGAGDVAGARAMAARARTLVEQLVAEDPRNVGNVAMLAGVLAMASGIEHRAGRHGEAIALAREAIAADARMPAETRAGLIVRENLNNARRVLGASACASAAGREGRAAWEEGRALLGEARGFKQELVARGIDARDAASALVEIEAELARCERALARLPAR